MDIDVSCNDVFEETSDVEKYKTYLSVAELYATSDTTWPIECSISHINQHIPWSTTFIVYTSLSFV